MKNVISAIVCMEHTNLEKKKETRGQKNLKGSIFDIFQKNTRSQALFSKVLNVNLK